MAVIARAALLALVGGLLCGCFVLEELDNSRELMEKPGFSSPAVPPSPARRSAAAAEDPTGAEAPDTSAWWGRARTLSSGPGNDALVACRVRGATQFMRRPDCLARGGTPARAGS